ncbi:hypothetical protein PF011_g23222 [Phytophthora fragariae]|uniref:Protein kinase domain-containing protein n=1 Tax=Phytophthora fragariae TaxID=53985 RepID=A0A6A3IFC5_9STRA|nr:hypothetical protein PF011_g23222 [Phytophthora fragariae]
MGNCFRRGERARREFNDAVILGDLKRVRRLIRYAKEGGEEGERGHLWWAAYLGHLEVVRYFVEQCVSGVDVSDASQDSAFLEAATWGHVAVVRYLTERRDANLNVSNALREAAGRGHLDVVKYLTERCDANLNVTDALLEAAGCGQVDIVQYLAERCDADVNAEDDFGYTALMKATYRGNVRLVRYLVEQCAVDVSAMTLTEAARKGRLNVVRYLVEQCGVDVNKEDKYGQTAVTAAVTAGEIEVVRHLVADCSVHVNSAAVRLAAECGYIDIQRILTPFLLAEPGETTKDGGDFVLSPGIPSRCFIPPSEIELTLFHENGSIGGDFLAKWLDSDVAVKLFIPDAFSTSFEDEVRLWQQLRHPNVLKMYGACYAGAHLKFFVCEFASNGSLLEHVNSSSVGKRTMWKYLYEAALGLEYLHERGIVHAELRCSNILIGSDGTVKLADFRLSGLRSKALIRQYGRWRNERPRMAGSVRWQSPEVMLGDTPSCESDVYSLAMCILEAATGKMPWSTIEEKEDGVVRFVKEYWAPEDESEKFTVRPNCPPGDARELVHEICCQDPHLRPNLSSVVYKLGNLAIKEYSDPNQPENEPISSFDEYKRGNINEAWMELETFMVKHSTVQYHREFAKLKKIRGHLQDSPMYQTLLERFHDLLVDFTQMVKISPEQAQMMQLSSTRVTTNSLYAFQWRIQSLMASLGEMGEVATEGEGRWQQQRNEQIEQFMSGVSDTFLLLNALKTVEGLKTLKEEMKTTGKYSHEQHEVMEKVYDDLASKLEGDDWSELAPVWFIPWYELVIDEWN